MLQNSNTFTSFSTNDFGASKEFFANKLGLKITEEIENAVIVFKTAGDTKFMVYVKEDHVPANFTVLNFEVDNLEKTIEELSQKGISMEIYPNTEQDAKGISKQGPTAMSWFLDPSGNIIGLIQKY